MFFLSLNFFFFFFSYFFFFSLFRSTRVNRKITFLVSQCHCYERNGDCKRENWINFLKRAICHAKMVLDRFSERF